MINPFNEKENTDTHDLILIEFAKNGDRKALEKLIERHQAWIYNISLRMVLNPDTAKDITQEILIKIITKLSTFKGKSSFRTWVYRITANHVINMKKSHCENKIVSFENYGKLIDDTPDLEFPDKKNLPADIPILVEEAKIGCMFGMLLCLNRDERFIYTLGEILNASDTIGSEICSISKENFRQKLSRARNNLYNFMNEKCSLIKQNNSCKCAKKTAAWIKTGIVDPDNLKFNKNYMQKIKDISKDKSKQFENLIDNEYADLFRNHPFQNPPDYIKLLNEVFEYDKTL